MIAVWPLEDDYTSTTAGCRTDVVYISVSDTAMRTGEDPPGLIVYYEEAATGEQWIADIEPELNAAHCFPEAWQDNDQVRAPDIRGPDVLWFITGRHIRAPPAIFRLVYVNAMQSLLYQASRVRPSVPITQNQWLSVNSR